MAGWGNDVRLFPHSISFSLFLAGSVSEDFLLQTLLHCPALTDICMQGLGTSWMMEFGKKIGSISPSHAMQRVYAVVEGRSIQSASVLYNHNPSGEVGRGACMSIHRKHSPHVDRPRFPVDGATSLRVSFFVEGSTLQ